MSNVQLSFEYASVKICKNQLTNQIEEKAEYFSIREQKNSQWKSALSRSKKRYRVEYLSLIREVKQTFLGDARRCTAG